MRTHIHTKYARMHASSSSSVSFKGIGGDGGWGWGLEDWHQRPESENRCDFSRCLPISVMAACRMLTVEDCPIVSRLVSKLVL